jgi:preprotein translocase subunit SecG
MLVTFLKIFHVLAGLSLVGLILLQQGKGADAGAAFGSGASATVFGARGSANFMTRATALLATFFFANSLFLTYMAGHAPTPTSVVERKDEVLDIKPLDKKPPGAPDDAPPAIPGAAPPPAATGPAGDAPPIPPSTAPAKPAAPADTSPVPAVPSAPPPESAAPSGPAAADVPPVPVAPAVPAKPEKAKPAKGTDKAHKGSKHKNDND